MATPSSDAVTTRVSSGLNSATRTGFSWRSSAIWREAKAARASCASACGTEGDSQRLSRGENTQSQATIEQLAIVGALGFDRECERGLPAYFPGLRDRARAGDDKHTAMAASKTAAQR